MRVRADRRRHTVEFRTEALELIERGDRTFKQLAADLGMSYWTLRNWYQAGMAKRKKGVSRPPGGKETVEERLVRLERENAELRRDNETLKLDREILKKAAAFFAKESK